MKWGVVFVALILATIVAQAQATLRFRVATHGVCTDSTLQNCKVLSVQKIKVTFAISQGAINMTTPSYNDTIPILKTYRKNGAIVYLVRHTPKAKAMVILQANTLRYVVRTNQNRFFETCYSNAK